jgi:serine/threonine protein kinase
LRFAVAEREREREREMEGVIGEEKDTEKEEKQQQPATTASPHGGGEMSSSSSKETPIKKTASMVRADMLNLADLDAALERHLSRSASKSKKAAAAAPPAERQEPRQEWEIDPREVLLKNVIAHGTFGTVHRGVYGGQDVAVKLLDWGNESTMTIEKVERLRSEFRQEVAVWHTLDHPNVTKFIGASMGNSDLRIPSTVMGDDGFFHVPNDACCVVVEYLPGGTLKDYLFRNRRRKLSFKTVIQLALDVSRGLAYLHSKKIAHRDVKSENMLLDKQRNVKIADFGVARVEAQNTRDMTGQTGTVNYMAPEVLDGKPYNKKCDVYSFGICLWEIYCCDMLPYGDLSMIEMTSLVVHQHRRPEIPRCCPHALANVMKKCWDGHPDKRPAMSEVVKMLEAIDTSKGGGMIPTDAEPKGCLCFGKYHGP